ncbi:MAG: SAM-dependent methyltransferase, partial [Moorella sp. (in: Bacteria)]|nr:SAM-dependent methyltransferase [Moorella sp. (in: firmicutes)]
MRLPKRLAAIAEFVPPGKVAADIGTDHAYLPVYLVQTGRSPRVIATELNEKPWMRARFWVSSFHLEDKIEVRLGAGLQVLSPGEVQVVVVAGMGQNTIRELLAATPAVLYRLERLILQPMSDAGNLRLWLVD